MATTLRVKEGQRHGGGERKGGQGGRVVVKKTSPRLEGGHEWVVRCGTRVAEDPVGGEACIGRRDGWIKGRALLREKIKLRWSIAVNFRRARRHMADFQGGEA
ncbi:hypothetical protein OsI_08683 [Oryza sativa Indica Group]|uniref:Uncharacterized protein n=1 Tax=Oryza sativa subsp. indica TaxID=39946 RepID=A2X8X2_ORYSI|nr:hypothetical protein OsI_08683 [Oryza sativa Indica Group]